jgi:Fe-S-cluster-containing dehydrogenase component
MTKWNLVIDVEKCEDCNNCFLACKDEHVDNDWPGYAISQPRHGHRWMNILRKERGQYPIIDVAYLPVPCMHCDVAPCIKAGKAGAVYKRDDGIVIIDPEKGRGQKDIVKACPYDAIWWNEEHKVPQKCTFCAHLLDDGWKEPRCVTACPTGAISVVRTKDRDMQATVASENLEALHPQFNANPRVYYKNLNRFTRCFIGGSVAYEKEGIIDCAEGARVALLKGSEKMGEAVTDNFGDFKFDRLEEESGKYTVEIVFKDYDKKALEVDLKTSISLGTITLS